MGDTSATWLAEPARLGCPTTEVRLEPGARDRSCQLRIGSISLESVRGHGGNTSDFGPHTVVPVEESRTPATEQPRPVPVTAKSRSDTAISTEVVAHRHPKRAVIVGVIPILQIIEPLGKRPEEQLLLSGGVGFSHTAIVADGVGCGRADDRRYSSSSR